MSMQLDLFQIAAENELADKIHSNAMTADDLKVGDIIHVVWSNGVQFDGICTGLRGFWDNRPEFRQWHWVYRYNIQHRDDPAPREGFYDYSHFDPDLDQWYWLGYDDEYQVPDREQILPRLIELLQGIPFPKRLATFQVFEKEYPYLSYDYNPGMTFLHEVWDTAIMAVSTLDEVLAAFKDWTCKAEMTKRVKAYIRDVVFPLAADQRMEGLYPIRWRRSGYKDEKGIHWWVHRFPRHTCSIYDGLLSRMIEQARTPEELVKLASMWGDKFDSTMDAKADFWVEELS